MLKIRNANIIFIVKSLLKFAYGKLTDNLVINVREVGCVVGKWMNLPQGCVSNVISIDAVES
jgi:hypothetical protein